MLCRNCSQTFEIAAEDLKFYERLEVPAPTHCPDCRQQRRLAFRNERQLYHRTCDATGKKILSVYSPEKKLVVYDNEHWYSDKWEAREFAQEFDFGKSFLEQFAALLSKVPQLARSAVANQNCDFVNQCGWCKNCYLIFEADYDENCYYSSHIYDSKFCSDNSYITKCELCYECVDCQNCYDCRFLQDCQNCAESWFLKSCIGCHNCCGCVNLRNKKFHIFNEPYSREEYFEKLAALNFDTTSGMSRFLEQFQEYALKFPQKYMHGVKNESSSGDYLNNTQNCQYCFDVQHSKDSKFVFDSRNVKNVYDMTVFGSIKGAEFSYENHEIGDGVRNIFFSDQIWNSGYDIWYSKLCVQNCHDLFGCVGLKHASHCILNKQYSPEEYAALKTKIIEHMKKNGEWGEFFPITLSPFGYNETLAQEYFPLTKEEVLAQGYKWKEEEEADFSEVTRKIPAEKLPDKIADIPDDILNWAIECPKSKKLFKIQKIELEFYRKMNLPIPRAHFESRHRRRMGLRNPRKLWQRNCMNCQAPIQTTYAPERPEIVYCEKCYLEAVE